jgi:hypothetical protein
VSKGLRTTSFGRAQTTFITIVRSTERSAAQPRPDGQSKRHFHRDSLQPLFSSASIESGVVWRVVCRVEGPEADLLRPARDPRRLAHSGGARRVLTRNRCDRGRIDASNEAPLSERVLQINTAVMGRPNLRCPGATIGLGGDFLLERLGFRSLMPPFVHSYEADITRKCGPWGSWATTCQSLNEE